ncbi:MAG: DUF1700 domain-containing protein [Clostridia bacterium]|nr:DUF1700 domain-containing protein [Clostridia bacterium]
MTYNEWRDELKSNLLSVTEDERQRVLDFYAEAYADKREAGKSEREIINDFGAPYDAAQRILNEKIDDEFKSDVTAEEKPTEIQQTDRKNEKLKKERDELKKECEELKKEKEREKSKSYGGKRSRGWLFVLFCIIFSIPIFVVIVMLASVSFAVTITPFALVAGGAAATGGSIGIMISGDIAYGLYTLGAGLVSLGAGIALFPLLLKLVKLIWKFFRIFFSALRRVIGGKERAV